MNADEVRELENMNPQADGQGKKYYVPLNWIPKEDAGEEMPSREPPEQIVDIDKEENSIKDYWQKIAPPEKREKLKIDHKMIHGLVRIEVSHQKSIQAVAQQVVSKECNAVKRAVKKLTKGKFIDWVDTFYADHEKYVREKYAPIMMTFFESIHQEASNVLGVTPEMTPDLEAFANNFVDRMAFTHCQSSIGQIKKIYNETPTEKRDHFDDLLSEGIENRADDWFLGRAGKVALDESARATNAMARETWATNGVTKLKWVAIGKSCDFCKGMDGRIVSIKRNFIDAGQVIYSGPNDTDFDIYDPAKGENVFSLNPRQKARDEKWQALKVYGNKAHPPIHKG